MSFTNTCEDHRLRVLFPTGLAEAREVDAGGQFHVDRRPARITRYEDDQYYDDMQTQPHQRFVSVSGGGAGLAILHDAITEYEVFDDADRTIALTLLRAVKCELCAEFRVVNSFPSQKGSQCLRDHSFQYRLVPYQGAWSDGRIAERAERFNTSVVLTQTLARKGPLPRSQAIFEVTPASLQIAAVKVAEDEDALILRVANLSARPVNALARFARPPLTACITDFKEVSQNSDGVTNDGDTTGFTVQAHQIVTLKVTFDKEQGS